MNNYNKHNFEYHYYPHKTSIFRNNENTLL